MTQNSFYSRFPVPLYYGTVTHQDSPLFSSSIDILELQNIKPPHNPGLPQSKYILEEEDTIEEMPYEDSESDRRLAHYYEIDYPTLDQKLPALVNCVPMGITHMNDDDNKYFALRAAVRMPNDEPGTENDYMVERLNQSSSPPILSRSPLDMNSVYDATPTSPGSSDSPIQSISQIPSLSQSAPPKLQSTKVHKEFLPITVWTKPVKKDKLEDKLARHEFKEKIVVAFTDDILSGKYSYEEVINKYKSVYPKYEHKFTKSFCSKIRCGRVMNTTNFKSTHRDHRIKRITRLSQRKDWTRMTPDLFEKILAWEHSLKRAVKQSEIETMWNVNRTTYHRWKKNYQQQTLNNPT
jgi:hypothetical protein